MMLDKEKSKYRDSDKKDWIIHVDGDAFFASCEQATNWRLRGRPIAVGRERGVATAFSYEAKALGVSRATKAHIIERDFPSVLLVSSDYRKYGIFSRRFKTIVARYVEEIENGGIDECYGLIRATRDKIQTIAENLKDEIETALGMTFSIGVAPTKALAKLGSGMNKPSGITILPRETLGKTVGKLPLGRVAGIGYRSEPKMNALGLYTIADFSKKSEAWVADHFHRPMQEMHKELQGIRIWQLETEPERPKSISKIRAFRPHTNNSDQLMSEFSRNAEIIASKMRRYGVEAYGFVCGLKYQKHTRTSCEIRLTKPITSATDMVRLVEQSFSKIYNPHISYRATYIVIYSLRPTKTQLDLFGNYQRKENRSQIDLSVDEYNTKHGKNALYLASSMQAFARKTDSGNLEKAKNDSEKATPLLLGRGGIKALYLPYLGVV